MMNLKKTFNNIWSQYGALILAASNKKEVTVIDNDKTYLSVIRYNLQNRITIKYADSEILLAWKSYIKKKIRENLVAAIRTDRRFKKGRRPYTS
ncbi:MAG: hypothetical protein HQK97_04550 [Nitrospirae bacterium]|nr:hypothetical protein [Nitrospirota bacterium]